jgi:hypothetical protein
VITGAIYSGKIEFCPAIQKNRIPSMGYENHFSQEQGHFPVITGADQRNNRAIARFPAMPNFQARACNDANASTFRFIHDVKERGGIHRHNENK